MKGREFKDAMYDGLAKMLKAISNPSRLEIIEMLSQGEKSVEGIVQTTNLTFANASQHLQVLKNNNIVKHRKEKQYVFYSLINDDFLSVYQHVIRYASQEIAELERIMSRQRKDNNSQNAVSFYDTSYTKEMFEKFTEPFYKDFKSQTKIFVESMFPENASKELVKMIADDMSLAPQDVAMQAFWGMYEYDEKIPEKLRLVRVPVYAINATMWPTNEEFNRQLAQSFEAEYMLNCGHFVMLENPRLFNEFLQKFVTKIVDEKNSQNK